MSEYTVPRRIPKSHLGNKRTGRLLSDDGLNFPVIQGEKGNYAIYQVPKKSNLRKTLKNDEDAIIKGGFGTVTIGQNIDTGEWVSVKIQNCRFQDKKRAQDIEQEILFSRKVGILKDLIKIKTKSQMKTYMICKLIGKGDDLFYHLSYATVKDKVYTFDEKLDIAISVVTDLKKRFHDKNLIHCDIKPENIVYDKSNRKGMLIDYGAVIDLNELKGRRYEVTHFEREGKMFYAETKVKKLTEIDNNTYFDRQEITGTRGFISPEALLDDKHLISKKYDIYAMGMCLYYLVTVNKKDEREASPFILRLYSLASNMCNYDPRERPTASKVLTQLKQIKYDWEKAKSKNRNSFKEKIRTEKKFQDVKPIKDINAIDRKGKTPLIRAIEINDIETIILLITDKKLNWKIHQFVLRWVKSTPVYKLINHLAKNNGIKQE